MKIVATVSVLTDLDSPPIVMAGVTEPYTVTLTTADETIIAMTLAFKETLFKHESLKYHSLTVYFSSAPASAWLVLGEMTRALLIAETNKITLPTSNASTKTVVELLAHVRDVVLPGAIDYIDLDVETKKEVTFSIQRLPDGLEPFLNKTYMLKNDTGEDVKVTSVYTSSSSYELRRKNDREFTISISQTPGQKTTWKDYNFDWLVYLLEEAKKAWVKAGKPAVASKKRMRL